MSQVADEIAELSVRAAINETRAKHGNQLPISDKDWARLKPLYAGQINALLNDPRHPIIATLFDNLDQNSRNTIANFEHVVSAMVGQIEAIRIHVGAPRGKDWPPKIACHEPCAKFRRIKNNMSKQESQDAESHKTDNEKRDRVRTR